MRLLACFVTLNAILMWLMIVGAADRGCVRVCECVRVCASVYVRVGVYASTCVWVCAFVGERHTGKTLATMGGAMEAHQREATEKPWYEGKYRDTDEDEPQDSQKWKTVKEWESESAM